MKKIILILMLICSLVIGLTLNSSYALGEEDIVIKDILSPEEVETGRALMSIIKIENVGTTDYIDIIFNVDIPELNLTSQGYSNELKKGDKASSEELYFRIPSCAEPGKYRINFEIAYDNKKITEERTINILEGDDLCDIASTIKPHEVEKVEEIRRCPSICGRNLSSGECICPPNYGFCYGNVGLRDIINNTEVYCNKGLWQEQKEDDQPCQNNFECLSNFCSKGSCYDVSLEVEETKSILQRILDWLKKVFRFKEHID